MRKDATINTLKIPQPISFIDLKSQYEVLRTTNERIQKVLDHGQYITGQEVKELEGQLASYTGANTASPSRVVPRRCSFR